MHDDDRMQGGVKPFSSTRADYLSVWAERVGPDAARLNWTAVVWRLWMAGSLVALSVPFVVAHVQGIEWIQLVAWGLWTVFGCVCLAMYFVMRERAQEAAASYLGWEGEPRKIPMTGVRLFDRWRLAMENASKLP